MHTLNEFTDSQNLPHIQVKTPGVPWSSLIYYIECCIISLTEENVKQHGSGVQILNIII